MSLQVMNTLSLPTLVLNKNWAPIATTSVRRGLTLLFAGAAKAVCPESFQVFDFDGWCEQEVAGHKVLQTSRQPIRIPEVLVLYHYGGHPKKSVNFSRKNLCLRDDFRCAYCGEIYKERDLTIDHVVPASRGGRTGWMNCVLACYSCNQRKSNRTPEEANMPLRFQPVAPKWTPHRMIPPERRPESWDRFLARKEV